MELLRINVATVHEQPQRSLTVVSGDHVCQAFTESEPSSSLAV